MHKAVLIGTTKIVAVRGDLTQQDTDAIVNAANSSLMGGGGVDGAIHRAGGPAIIEECRKIVAEIGRLPAGEAVITTGGNLPAAFVIHTVGPIWHGGTKNEPRTLANAYRSSLELAREKGLRSISFPSISTGAYGYPVEEAAEIALKSVAKYVVKKPFDVVRFVLFSESDFRVYAGLLADLG
ncbi:MAG: Appr-p processing domain protein [Candidatus Krumholzibacteriota bacterium]|nr:Appr-p processing domain protein [Candidatus Krumholzibacteriota bacterium]